jgi:hypothetical protein
MKYINKFSTNADYQAFTEGEGYVTPNVCYVEESDGIVMKPLVFEESWEYERHFSYTFEEMVENDANMYGDFSEFYEFLYNMIHVLGEDKYNRKWLEPIPNECNITFVGFKLTFAYYAYSCITLNFQKGEEYGEVVLSPDNFFIESYPGA